MSHRKLGAALLAACSLIILAAPAAAPAQSSKSREVKIMTRNLYLGADLIPLAVPGTDQATFEQAAAARFQTVLKNDFQVRSRRIAEEIRRYKPDLIGLQEAARWLRGPDGVKDGSVTPANDVIYDSTEVLLKHLRALGQRYRVVASRPWFDFEAPTALGFDVRLIQHDVILVRQGSKVRVGRTFRGGFRDTFDPPTVIGVARQRRGWVGTDARIGNRRFRLVTTHLEAYSPEIGDKQVKQLLRGPLKSKRLQSILVGDLNSGPRAGSDRGTQRTANPYETVIRAGFVNPLPRRNTCCFGEDLSSTSEKLSSWIDHILVRPRARVVRSSVFGNRTSDRIGGMWPSDHAGVVATLRLR
jgi:endonuclease/exonuclease/phosphatase family metal-dependent hydrolase